jgi:hypothetical protein
MKLDFSTPTTRINTLLKQGKLKLQPGALDAIRQHKDVLEARVLLDRVFLESINRLSTDDLNLMKRYYSDHIKTPTVNSILEKIELTLNDR